VNDFDNFFDPLVVMVGGLERLDRRGCCSLAVVIAALGVVNATVVNVAERRREIRAAARRGCNTPPGVPGGAEVRPRCSV